MSRVKRWGWLAIPVLLLIFAAVAMRLDPSSPTPPRTDISAAVVYAESFTDLSGKAVDLGRFENQVLVLNFWATWCPPCLEEMPMLSRFQHEHRQYGVQVLGIAADSAVNVAKFAQKHQVSFPLLPDEVRAVAFSKRLGNRLGVLPFTVVIAPGGEMVMQRVGVLKEGELEAVVLKITKKSLK